MEKITDRDIKAKFGSKREFERFMRHECRIYCAPAHCATVDTYKKILNGVILVSLENSLVILRCLCLL